MRRGSISRSSGGGRSSYSGSRINRSSRRHHRHYHHSYMRRQFTGLVFLVIVLLIIGYISMTWGIAGTVGDVDRSEISLEPGQTMKVEKSMVWDSGMSLSIQNGDITGYYFEEEPELSVHQSYPVNYTIEAQEDETEYIYFQANKGSTLRGSFSTSSNFGSSSNFVSVGLYYASSVDLEEGDFGEHVASIDADEEYNQELEISGHYYLAMTGVPFGSTTFTFDMTLDTVNHDLNGASTEIDDYSDISLAKEGKNVIILANEGTEVVDAQLSVNPRIPTPLMFLLIQFLVGFVFFQIKGRLRKNETQPRQQDQNLSKLNKSTDGYYQRPKPNYCGYCGTSLPEPGGNCRACGK